MPKGKVPIHLAIDYVAGHEVVRDTLTTTAGRVTLTPPAGKKIVSMAVSLQRAVGDTSGQYSWCLHQGFQPDIGGILLVYDMAGVDAPNGTKVILWRELADI